MNIYSKNKYFCSEIALSILFFGQIIFGSSYLLAQTTSPASSSLLFSSEENMQQDQVGQIKLQDFLLNPRLYSGDQSYIDLHYSQFAVLWDNHNIAAQIRIGPQSLRNAKLWAKDEQSQEFGVIEAYASYSSLNWGKLQMGLMPIEFSWEGQNREEALWFDRSYMYSEGWMSLRDYAIGQKINNGPFELRWFIHNGESFVSRSGTQNIQNEDSRFYFTSAFNYNFESNLVLSLSGQVGEYFEDSDVDKRKVRMANFFVYYPWYDYKLLLSGSVGDHKTDDESEVTQFANVFFDINYYWNKKWSNKVRVEHYDPDHFIDNNEMQKYVLALVYELADESLLSSNQNQISSSNSNIELAYVHENEDSEVKDRSLYLSWKIQSILN